MNLNYVKGLFIWAITLHLQDLGLTSEVNFRHCLYGFFMSGLTSEVNQVNKAEFTLPHR